MVARILLWPTCRVHWPSNGHISTSRCFYSTRISKPLRILFCGSDLFSCASLRAIRQEQLRDPKSIASIDVLARPGKLSGRGLKSIREVPIKSLGRELGLAVHERDTFTGWTPPRPNEEPINLIVAVSFGLKVPPRILDSAEYGGINVHPSLLPDFRGPAPLHHTLLAGEIHTGVTLQTLHPEKIDHGTILAQTPSLEIPNASQCTYEELLSFITPKAAEILVQGIRNRVFLSDPTGPHNASNNDITFTPSAKSGRALRPAPKITTEDRHIDWMEWTTESLLRRDRVIGRLWDFCQPRGKPKTRIILDGISKVGATAPDFGSPEVWNQLTCAASAQPRDIDSLRDREDGGKYFLLPFISAGYQRVKIPCVEYEGAVLMGYPSGDALLVREITIEGGMKKPAAKALAEWSRSAEIRAASIDM